MWDLISGNFLSPIFVDYPAPARRLFVHSSKAVLFVDQKPDDDPVRARIVGLLDKRPQSGKTTAIRTAVLPSRPKRSWIAHQKLELGNSSTQQGSVPEMVTQQYHTPPKHTSRLFGINATAHTQAETKSPPSFVSAAQEHLDARLTDVGKEQCATLKATNHGIEKEAELVVVSPLTRAIQTAMLTIDQVRHASFGSVMVSPHWFCGKPGVSKPIAEIPSPHPHAFRSCT